MSQIIPVKIRILAGDVLRFKVRPIPDDRIRDHGTLCRAFGLDPHRTRFDLPRSWGEAPAPGRSQDAMVFFDDPALRGRPLATLHRMSEAEKIPDDNPTDPRDFFNLNNRI